MKKPSAKKLVSPLTKEELKLIRKRWSPWAAELIIQSFMDPPSPPQEPEPGADSDEDPKAQ